MTAKVEAYEYEGLLFKTEDEVVKYKAVVALRKAYRSNGSIYYNALNDIIDDPKKCYLILKEFYSDR